MLETEPSARYLINVCNSVACYFSKGERAADLLKEELGIAPGEITEDGLFAIRYCSCVGACEKAPVMKINDDVYGCLTREKVHVSRELCSNTRLTCLLDTPNRRFGCSGDDC